jgi:hypothetical protein
MNTLGDPFDDGLWLVSDTPPVGRLIDEFKKAGGLSSNSVRKRRNDRIRYCKWEGRAQDYKKHRELLSRDPVPYEDAWDGRIYLADGILMDIGDMLESAFARAQIKMKPTGAEDTAQAANSEKVLGKYIERDRTILNDEAGLMWQFGGGYGASMWQVYWDRQIAMKMVPISMERLEEAAQMAQQALLGAYSEGIEIPIEVAQQAQTVAYFPQQIMDKDRESEAVEVLQQIAQTVAAQLFQPEREAYGDSWLLNYKMSAKMARKCIRSLRENGSGSFPAPFLSKNAPCVVAREVGYDYFSPQDMTDPETSPWHMVREWLTPAQIMERKAVDGWDADWCEKVIKTVGQSTEWGPDIAMVDDSEEDDDAETFNPSTRTGHTYLCEVIHAYVRYTTDEGIPQIWCTVMSPHTMKTERGDDLWGKHYPMTDSSSYGFFPFRWQRRRRNFHDNIGIPELVGSDQQLIKRTLDQLTDRADMELNPPWMVANRMSMKYKAGPGAQIPRRRAGDLEPAPPPPGSPALGFELIKEARYRIDNYFGFMTENVLPAKWQNKLQAVVGRYLGSAQAMFKYYWRLIQENADEEELARIAGGATNFPTSPEDISGDFDVAMAFDVKDLDMEFVFKKLDAVAKMAVPLDRAGVIDLAAMVKLIITAIDPTYAQALVKDEQGAAQAVYRDVDTQVLRMYAGNEAEFTENDPTANMKLQFLQQVIQGNPLYQQALGIQDGQQPNPLFVERVQKYQKNLQQSVQQEQNKMTGRLGVQPDNQMQAAL